MITKTEEEIKEKIEELSHTNTSILQLVTNWDDYEQGYSDALKWVLKENLE